jgi:thiol-disulfide isomerase/thioredoxin
MNVVVLIVDISSESFIVSHPSPPSHTTRNTWMLLAALAAGLLLVVWLRPLETVFRRSATSHAGVGQALPALGLEPLTADATPVNLAELKGNVLLVSFWGTWCPPCREEMPHLAEMSHGLTGDDFRLVAISCGGGEDEDLGELRTATQTFLTATNLKIAAYADPGGQLRKALTPRGAFNGFFPTTLAVDRRGVIRAVWEGYFPGAEREMERLVASLLVER